MATTTFEKPMGTEVETLKSQISTLNGNIGTLSDVVDTKGTIVSCGAATSSKNVKITGTKSQVADFLLIADGSNSGRMAIAICRVSNNSAYLFEVAKGSNISFSTASNAVIVSNSASAATTVYAVILNANGEDRISYSEVSVT